jgi:hypothetical protein
MNTAALHGTEKETQKNDLSINQRLAGTCKRYNSTEEGGGKEVERFIGEGVGE